MIPRVFWPDKPLTTTNKWFAITYGITTEEGAEKSNFGISLLGECYVNFGLAGVIFMMMFQGAALSTLEQIFSGEKSGAGGHAVFLAFSIWFLNGVGTSAEVLFGAILQNMICSCAILIWLRKRRPFDLRFAPILVCRPRLPPSVIERDESLERGF